jgi:hypothetical protein
MTVAAYEKPVLHCPGVAAADYSSYQYYAVRKTSDTAMTKVATAGVYGMPLQDKPESGEACTAGQLGVFKAKAGGTWAVGDLLTTNASGEFITRTSNAEVICGQAMQVAASGDVKAMFCYPGNTVRNEIRSVTKDITSAQLIAYSANQIVVDHSDLVTAGEIASGDHLIFQGAVCQVYGGSANYDNNQNIIFKNTTGTSLSLTLANLMNGSAAGVTKTCKPLATDIASVAGDDIEFTNSASPKTSTGDRLLRVTVYYSVFTPHA